LVVPNKRGATPDGLIGGPTLRDGAIFPQDRVALSLMYSKYTTLSAPCPAKKWPTPMGIRIVLTGPQDKILRLFSRCGILRIVTHDACAASNHLISRQVD